jgi:hypothetical protein
MAVIRHFEANPEERAAYLKQRRLMAGVTEEGPRPTRTRLPPGDLSQERYAEMSAAEDLILTITRGGSGKLSSSHDYPVRGRGGQGVIAMDKAMRGGAAGGLFPGRDGGPDHAGHLHRPVDPRAGRRHLLPLALRGWVKVFNTGAGEQVGLGRLDRRSRATKTRRSIDDARARPTPPERLAAPKCGGAAINFLRIFTQALPICDRLHRAVWRHPSHLGPRVSILISGPRVFFRTRAAGASGPKTRVQYGSQDCSQD